jgi:hypothetical protein
MQNPSLKFYSEFDRKYSALIKKVIAEIVDKIGTETDPLKIGLIVNETFKKYDVKAKAKNFVMDSIAKSVAVGAGIKEASAPLVIKRWYLENVYDASGVKFSDKINDLARTNEMIVHIKKSLKTGSSWRKAAQDLSDTGIQAKDVAKDVDNLLTKARQGFKLANDPEGYKKYYREVRKVQSRINSLVEPGTSKLKRAYQDIVDLSDGASAKALENAEYYAGYFKQRYNAERIASTEISRAYTQGKQINALANDDIIGFQVVLSTAHAKFDICDFWANNDAYGMGKGCSPKTHMPPFPFHPHDWCILVEIYSGETKEASGDDYNHDKIKKFISNLSKEDQDSLMGKGGAEAFRENPDSWANQINSFKKPRDVKFKNVGKLKEALYGGNK